MAQIFSFVFRTKFRETFFLIVLCALVAGVLGYAASPASAAVTDDGARLIVPVGETYVLGGDHYYSAKVDIAGTLVVAPFDPAAASTTGRLAVRSAGPITISGQVRGDAAGSRGGISSEGGTGRGGDGGTFIVSLTGAGGGAGYGGRGGAGGGLIILGSDGTGGSAYGSNASYDAQPGSAGGTSFNASIGGLGSTVGGRGGASVFFESSETIVVSGAILVTGETGTTVSGLANGPGAGSGGTAFLSGRVVSVSGLVDAGGGRGGSNSRALLSQGDGGGGAGGGRIKLFFVDSLDSSSATLRVAGGTGGAAALVGNTGAAGAAGTVFSGSSAGTARLSDSTFSGSVTALETALYIEVRDLSANNNPALRETVTVVVSGSDTEVVVLTETETSSAIFRGTLQLSSTVGLSEQDGTFAARLGESITVIYVDRVFAGDVSTATGVSIAVPTSSTMTIDTGWLGVNDTVAITLTDADKNRDPYARDTVSVEVIVGAETGLVALTETSDTSGIFKGSLATSSSASNSILGGIAAVRAGETITINYVDPNDALDTSVSNLILVTIAPVHSSGMFPSTLTIGDSIAFTITDLDENRSAARIDTIAVTVINNSTREQEGVVLTESGPNSGVFSGSVATSGSSVNNADNSGILSVLAGETVAIQYTDSNDPLDVATSGNLTGVLPAASSTGIFPSTLTIGDSIAFTITDLDENRSAARIDTIAVTVINNSTREQEGVVLTENGPNSGVFSGSVATSGSSVNNADNSGILSVLAGETVVIRYTDSNDPLDVATSGNLTGVLPGSSSTGIFPSTLTIGDSIAFTITDLDENRSAARIDTIAVTVINNSTREQEGVVLTESGPNSGVFSGSVASSGLSSDNVDNSGILSVLAGETVVLRYTDSNDPLDVATSGNLTGVLPGSSSTGIFPSTLTIGDSIAFTITDLDENRSATRIDTISVTVINNSTCEREVVVLTESGANSGVFSGSVASSGLRSDNADNSGILSVLAGETVVIRYTDSNDPLDVATSGNLTGVLPGSSSTGIFPSTLTIGDSIAFTITDLDENRSATRIDTVAVTVINNSTGERETVILTESGPNSGVFSGSVSTSGAAADGGSNSGTLALEPGDSVDITYRDNDDAHDFISARVLDARWPVTSSRPTWPENLLIGQPIDILIVDRDQNQNARRVEVITVTITNHTSGETEILRLVEMDPMTLIESTNSDIFGINELPTSRNGGASGSGVLGIEPGDTVIFRYVNPTDSGDAQVSSPLTARHPENPASGTIAGEIFIGDMLNLELHDTDRNHAAKKSETVLVMIYNSRSGLREVVELLESDRNSGRFLGGLRVASDNLLLAQTGDTLIVTYVDPTWESDVLSLGPVLIRPTASRVSGNIASRFFIGDSLAPELRDPSRNTDARARDRFEIVATNSRNGDSELVVFEETDISSGIFRGSIITAIDGVSADGAVDASTFDVIVFTYADPSDSTDTLILSTTAYARFHDEMQQIKITPEHDGDTVLLIFSPTGRRGESLPSLAGQVMKVTISDSIGGTGRLSADTVLFEGDTAALIYSRNEEARLFLTVSLLEETFHPIVVLTASHKEPAIVVGRRSSTGADGIMELPADFPLGSMKLMVEPYSDFATETATFRAMIDEANLAAAGSRMGLRPGVVPEQQFLIVTAPGNTMHKLPREIKISIQYPDADGDGIVDGTTVPENSLHIHYLDETLHRWVQVTNVTRDPARNIVTATVNHLSIFTLVGVSNAAGADGVLVYPNPYRPNDNDPDNGKPYASGDLSSGVIFDQVPAGAKIRVYSQIGELIMNKTVASGGVFHWDVRNDANRELASGIYIVIVDAPNGTRRMEKLAVIR